jgi:hypothetical protein
MTRSRASRSWRVPEKDRLHSEIAEELARGLVLPAKAAALFDIDEPRLRALAMEAYPVSLPEVAVAIATKQLIAALDEARGQGHVRDALPLLGKYAHHGHVVTLVAQARTKPGTSPGVR